MSSGWHVDSAVIRRQNCFEPMNVALHKLAPRLRQKYSFMQKMAAVFLLVQRLAKWVDRNGQLEGKQTRCEVEAKPGLLSTASRFFFNLFFLWISLLMWRLFFSTKTFYSVSSQPTQVERFREFVGSVRQLCCSCSIRGTRKSITPRTDKHPGQILDFFLPFCCPGLRLGTRNLFTDFLIFT